mmetsp:Transcript_6709/g.19845  ORF Transcript_6709/g.19845 Transcript_6709/m.19845 type:complete len:229 (-) Transcript_6709:397-1083(-)
MRREGACTDDARTPWPSPDEPSTTARTAPPIPYSVSAPRRRRPFPIFACTPGGCRWTRWSRWIRWRPRSNGTTNRREASSIRTSSLSPRAGRPAPTGASAARRSDRRPRGRGIDRAGTGTTWSPPGRRSIRPSPRTPMCICAVEGRSSILRWWSRWRRYSRRRRRPSDPIRPFPRTDDRDNLRPSPDRASPERCPRRRWRRARHRILLLDDETRFGGRRRRSGKNPYV